MAALAAEVAAAVDGPEFSIGDRVRITGIQARPELNGTVTVIKTYQPDKVYTAAHWPPQGHPRCFNRIRPRQHARRWLTCCLTTISFGT